MANAGVALGTRGLLQVDSHYRTKVPDIYAVGDVIGSPALASTSLEQARVAISHAFNGKYKKEIGPLLPDGIYTIPEVSTVGQTEQSLVAEDVDSKCKR